MGASGNTGPDMMKMLQMMLPYMDSSTKRMMSIMMKLQELRQLMEPAESVKKETAAKPQQADNEPNREAATDQAMETANSHRSMGDKTSMMQNDNLAAKLQEGLTPEQQSMITSLTGMLG